MKFHYDEPLSEVISLERKMPVGNNQVKVVEYLLPLKWSLHYVMTDKEWQYFRNRVKMTNPEWIVCSCSNGCRANSLDEKWEYIRESHVKRLIKAEFICSGCHWAKTLPWRIETWLKMENGLLAPATNSPHIITCLGWTQEQVDMLRKKDLLKHQHETEELNRIEKGAELGLIEIRYWSADLSAMRQYGYSSYDITKFEKKMNSRR